MSCFLRQMWTNLRPIGLDGGAAGSLDCPFWLPSACVGATGGVPLRTGLRGRVERETLGDSGGGWNIRENTVLLF